MRVVIKYQHDTSEHSPSKDRSTSLYFNRLSINEAAERGYTYCRARFSFGNYQASLVHRNNHGVYLRAIATNPGGKPVVILLVDLS